MTYARGTSNPQRTDPAQFLADLDPQRIKDTTGHIGSSDLNPGRDHGHDGVGDLADQLGGSKQKR